MLLSRDFNFKFYCTYFDDKIIKKYNKSFSWLIFHKNILIILKMVEKFVE